MDTTERTVRTSEVAQARGTSGAISERQAQIFAALITLLVFGAISFGLNTLFISLGQ